MTSCSSSSSSNVAGPSHQAGGFDRPAALPRWLSTAARSRAARIRSATRPGTGRSGPVTRKTSSPTLRRSSSRPTSLLCRAAAGGRHRRTHPRARPARRAGRRSPEAVRHGRTRAGSPSGDRKSGVEHPHETHTCLVGRTALLAREGEGPRDTSGPAAAGAGREMARASDAIDTRSAAAAMSMATTASRRSAQRMASKSARSTRVVLMPCRMTTSSVVRWSRSTRTDASPRSVVTARDQRHRERGASVCGQTVEERRPVQPAAGPSRHRAAVGPSRIDCSRIRCSGTSGSTRRGRRDPGSSGASPVRGPAPGSDR